MHGYEFQIRLLRDVGGAYWIGNKLHGTKVLKGVYTVQGVSDDGKAFHILSSRNHEYVITKDTANEYGEFSGKPLRDNPHHDEEPNEKPDFEESIVIQDRRYGNGYEALYSRKAIAANHEWDVLMDDINRWMEKSNYFPDVYYVNERGNIDLINVRTGKVIKSWV